MASKDTNNNSCNNKNQDLNYQLYKKVFTNKYLSNIIFSKVKEINYNATYSYILKNYSYVMKSIDRGDFGQFNQIMDKRCMDYNQVTYEIIFKNRLVEIFRDRLKMNRKFRNDEPLELIQLHFINFASGSKISNQEFKQFYQLNRFYLNKNENSDPYKENPDLFELLIVRRDYEKLQIVYEIEKDAIETEKNYYYMVKQEDSEFNSLYGFKQNIIPRASDYKRHVKSPFSIYFNHLLLKKSIQSSTLEIVRFLDQVLLLDYQYHSSKLLEWSLVSYDNTERDKIINYFLDQSFSCVKESFASKEPAYYFDKLLYLNYPTFCRIVNNQDGQTLYNNQFTSYTNRILKHSYYSGGLVLLSSYSRSELNHLLISLHCEYIQTNSIKKLFLLNLIKRLDTNGSGLFWFLIKLLVKLR